MAEFDAKAHLRTAITQILQFLTRDLQAIPAEKKDAGHGGCSRGALNMVAECAALNGLIATVLAGGHPELPSGEERERWLAQFDTEEKTLSYLQQETERLLAAIDALDADTLGDTIDLFPGMPMTRYAAAELAITHMYYHDGQLNYIQTINNDSAVHWR